MGLFDKLFGGKDEKHPQDMGIGESVAPSDEVALGGEPAETDIDDAVVETAEVVPCSEDAGGDTQDDAPVLDDAEGMEFVDGHATVVKDGVAYDVYDMSARCGMEVVETPADDSREETTTANETEETFPDEGVMTDGQAKVLLDLVMDAQMDKDVPAEVSGEADDDTPSVTFRAGEAIEPIGFDAPFHAANATGEMMVDWHLRLVYDHDMPDGDDEPIVELYDVERDEFVSDYWVSTFCDDSDENEGQGLACKGADKRYRIMYDDLVAMQELVRPVEAVEEWYAAHVDDMPDHNI